MWCDGFMLNVTNGYSQQLIATEGYSTVSNNMSVAPQDCLSTLQVPYHDCLNLWENIANRCDTSSGEIHGGTFQSGCVLFSMSITPAN